MRERGAQEIVEPCQSSQDQDAFENVGDRFAEIEKAADRPAGGGAGPMSSVPTRMATLSSVVAFVQLIGTASAKALSPRSYSKRAR